MDAGSRLEHTVPEGFNCFIYTIKWKGIVGDTRVNDSTCVTFELEGRAIRFEAIEKFEFVLLAGKPINEPVYQHGPFVMTTKEEMEETFNDYNKGINGFEGNRDLKSLIARGKIQ